MGCCSEAGKYNVGKNESVDIVIFKVVEVRCESRWSRGSDRVINSIALTE